MGNDYIENTYEYFPWALYSIIFSVIKLGRESLVSQKRDIFCKELSTLEKLRIESILKYVWMPVLPFGAQETGVSADQ